MNNRVPAAIILLLGLGLFYDDTSYAAVMPADSGSDPDALSSKPEGVPLSLPVTNSEKGHVLQGERSAVNRAMEEKLDALRAQNHALAVENTRLKSTRADASTVPGSSDLSPADQSYLRADTLLAKQVEKVDILTARNQVLETEIVRLKLAAQPARPGSDLAAECQTRTAELTAEVSRLRSARAELGSKRPPDPTSAGGGDTVPPASPAGNETLQDDAARAKALQELLAPGPNQPDIRRSDIPGF